MAQIDIDKFVISLRRCFGEDKGIATTLDRCLFSLGLQYVDTPTGGRLERVDQPTMLENIMWGSGEQKPAEISNICEFSIKTWMKIVDYVLTEHNGIGNYLIDPEVKDTAEKLQKKYKFDAASEEWDRVYRKGLDAGVNKGRAEALREQKSWSEEDEKAINDIMWIIEAYRKNGFNERHKQIANNAEKWLKSLKDRVLPQPKQEWSEKDKERIEQICDDLKSGMINFYANKVVKGLHYEEIIESNIEWLKSLRPQSTWKPSKEQIEALEKTLKYFQMLNAFGETIDELKELKEQLEKLME